MIANTTDKELNNNLSELDRGLRDSVFIKGQPLFSVNEGLKTLGYTKGKYEFDSEGFQLSFEKPTAEINLYCLYGETNEFVLFTSFD